MTHNSTDFFHLRCQPQRPPISHYNSLEGLSPPMPVTPATTTPNESLRLGPPPLPPATPATPTLLLAMPATSTTNESYDLLVGLASIRSPPPPTSRCDLLGVLPASICPLPP